MKTFYVQIAETTIVKTSVRSGVITVRVPDDFTDNAGILNFAHDLYTAGEASVRWAPAKTEIEPESEPEISLTLISDQTT